MNHMRPLPNANRRARRLAGAVALTAATVVTGCAADEDAGDVTTSSEAGAADGSTGTSAAADGTDGETSTTAGGSSSTSQTSATPAGPLPGEPIEGFARDGDLLAVMGVVHDDALNIRAAPGVDQDIVATAGPIATALVATGEARSLPNSIWYEVEVNGVTGWASIAFLAFLGGTDDATAEFLDGDPPPGAETMAQLGQLVAQHYASEEPPSSIVQSVAPTVGDLGEVTYDVVGLGDDAVAGYRLHVFGTPDESGEGFVLRTIERTYFCSRGTTGELCS